MLCSSPSSRRLWLVVVLLVRTLAAAAATSPRQTISFDFGWKHRTGLTDWAAWDDSPPTKTDPGLKPPEAAVEYDDKDWWNVQLPHDGLIVNPPSQKACPNGCSGRSYIPRHVLWYRKTLSLPQEWTTTNASNSRVFLEFQGSFRNTTVWLNGENVLTHECGYTPFNVSIPAISDPQTIAVFVDPDNGDDGSPSTGSGWWYEGGGLYRHVYLTRTSRNVYVQENSLFVKSHLQESDSSTALMEVEANIVVNSNDSKLGSYCYQIQVIHPQGYKVVSSPPTKLPTHYVTGPQPIHQSLKIHHPQLWTSSQPNLYKVSLLVVDCNDINDKLDVVSVQHGIRSIRFDANQGFFLNDAHYKIRGFCDHDTFAVVGMAVPDRINLFRAQASRAIGGNGRRTSHNPPDPVLLEIYDRLGMVVMDENRLFDGDHPKYLDNMRDLVKRDRNHASVVIWSFCNEGGCEGEHERGGPAFQHVVEELDGTRPTLANMFTFNDLLSNTVDVQGFSHQSREWLNQCHETIPHKPIFMSECCSCNTMRDEDEGCETTRDNPHTKCIQKAFNARCLDKLVNASDGVAYTAGTMIWTLFDYYGEPPVGGLEVSSTYGQYDLCGFPKAAAFWFRSQWLLPIEDQKQDKPFPTNGAHEVHLVESWERPSNNQTKSIHAYSNAPFIELYVNGKTLGKRPVQPMVKGNGGSYAEWKNVPWKAGTIKAVAVAANGTQVAQTSRSTNDKAAALVLALDCPSPVTGTGSALLLDGQDVALVRASIVDSQGQTVHMATNDISFAIISGPGMIQGTANGDPKSYQPHTSPSQTAYHGLVRAVVRATSIAGLSERERAIMASVDDLSLSESYPSMLDENDIVVEATSSGFEPARLRIPTSTDAATASVMTVAETGAGKPVDFFGLHEHEKWLLQESDAAATKMD